MSIESAALDHHCNVVRRQVQEEFPDLTLLFVVCKDGQKEQAVKGESARLLAWPGGERILEIFKSCAAQDKDGFLGLIQSEQKTMLGLKRQPHYYGLFFVGTDGHKTMNTAQTDLYHLAWHAIDLYQNHKKGFGKTRYTESEGFIEGKQTPAMLSVSNLMADVFTGILLALIDNDRRQIRKLARRRAELTLAPTLHYRAELYPYPVALETTEMVYDDLKDTLDPKLKIYSRALQLAHEVRLTHDEQSIKQWWAFSARAQEMAWLGCTPKTILNAAIYTSEDPYVKATAYLAAEALGIEPELSAETLPYNPFTENEVNERMHGKLCDKILRQVLERVQKHDDPYYFLEEAQHQNNRLKDGHVSGWCAHALLKLGQAYETEKKLQNAQELFHAQLKTLPWDELHKLSRAVMKQRRAGERITKKTLFGITESETGLRLVAQAFEATDGKEFSAKEKTAVRKPAPSKQVYDSDLPPILSHLREEE